MELEWVSWLLTGGGRFVSTGAGVAGMPDDCGGTVCAGAGNDAERNRGDRDQRDSWRNGNGGSNSFNVLHDIQHGGIPTWRPEVIVAACPGPNPAKRRPS